MSIPLFQFGEFTLASGRTSHFKLECDAITPEEWHTLARIAREILPPFGYVIGVPRGGVAWANIFQHYVRPGCKDILFVDDVWTTGGSLLGHVDRFAWSEGQNWYGIVLFARGPVPENVTALFRLNERVR